MGVNRIPTNRRYSLDWRPVLAPTASVTARLSLGGIYVIHGQQCPSVHGWNVGLALGPLLRVSIRQRSYGLTGLLAAVGVPRAHARFLKMVAESARGAASGWPPVRFSTPLTELPVPVSRQRTLHGVCRQGPWCAAPVGWGSCYCSDGIRYTRPRQCSTTRSRPPPACATGRERQRSDGGRPSADSSVCRPSEAQFEGKAQLLACPHD